MLIDRLLKTFDKKHLLYPWLETARVFSIDAKVGDAAFEFSTDRSFVNALVQTARTPFGSDFHFIEMNAGASITNQIESTTGSRETVRSCFLFREQEIDSARCLEIYHLREDSVFRFGFLVNLKDLTMDETGNVSISWKAFNIYTLEPLKNEDVLEDTADLIMSCAFTVCSILAIMNSPKIIEKENHNFTEWNEKRIKNKQQPLKDYTSIKLKTEIERAVSSMNKDAPLEFDSRGRRIHWRRGHFKHRATGTFWWSAHLAGTGTTPTEKRYDVGV